MSLLTAPLAVVYDRQHGDYAIRLGRRAFGFFRLGDYGRYHRFERHDSHMGYGWKFWLGHEWVVMWHVYSPSAMTGGR